MGVLTVRLSDEKHQRLNALAKSRGTPLNRLIYEMATLMLSEFDATTRFEIRAARGESNAERRLALRVLNTVEVTLLGLWQAIALEPLIQRRQRHAQPVDAF
ncbi:toxin-antitoxin system HicB family antitoxin [Dechloromonas sp. ZY10]|uniref:toxin-antitoxin system HicB family antitoxin n=1 Tax=Dechloromonas aquae TaxID=2664436 RepID=UPI0035291276